MTLAVDRPERSTHTGGSLGDYEQMSAQVATKADQHTRVRAVGNSSLRDVLGQFDNALTAPLGALRSLRSATGLAETYLLDRRTAFFDVVSTIAEQAMAAIVVIESVRADDDRPSASVAGHDDAVVVVEQLVNRLGVPARDVLAAAGISRSTFYSWKVPAAPRPRVASQGQLWALAQTVEDLRELLGDSLRGWLLSHPTRTTLLRRGDLDALLADAEKQTRTRPQAAPDYAAAYGVGGDRVEPEGNIPAARARRRTLPAPAAPQRRSDRRPS
jgi:hypothetical protein